MKARESFLNALNFKKVEERLPMFEWAGIWNQTYDRWVKEGLPQDPEAIRQFMGWDRTAGMWLRPHTGKSWAAYHNNSITTMEKYEAIKQLMFPMDIVEQNRERLLEIKEAHDQGDVIVWLTLEGYFWFPRILMGIEQHFYAFYDCPDVMHRMNRDLAQFNLHVFKEFVKILKPDLIFFNEDMSYNHGPMLSRQLFDEFMLPYYNEVIPFIKEHDIKIIIDSDGNVEDMIPWFQDAGIDGVLPLERQAGCDVNRIRKKYPHFLMIGGFDKMVMNKGEAAIREEFERLLPAMKSGGFIVSTDHQVPPSVSLEQYKTYMRIYEEYCRKAVE